MQKPPGRRKAAVRPLLLKRYNRRNFMTYLKHCHHHGFTVWDLDRSLKFYRDFLGLELVSVSERKDLPSYDRIIALKSRLGPA